MKVRLLTIAFGFGLILGLPLAAAAGPTSSADTDSDSIDDIFDNCRQTSNLTQVDTDHDGCGDSCSNPKGDFNGDGLVGTPDFFTWRNEFKASCTGPSCKGDANGDNIVGTPDFFTWRNEFKAGGWYLSGLPQAQVDGPPCQTNGP